MNRKLQLLGMLCLLLYTSVCKAAPVIIKQFMNPKVWCFVENKGQLANEHGDLINDVKYYSHTGNVNVYCMPGKISFVFTRVENAPIQVSEATGQQVSPIEEKQTRNISFNRLDLLLINSNPVSIISAADKQEYYENFYLAHTTGKSLDVSGQASQAPDNGITNVHTYKTVVYKNIYPEIDLVLHTQESGIKYEFVVNPGGKVGDIHLEWEGAQKIAANKNGTIHYETSLGEMNEEKPFSFFTSMSGKTCPVESHFIKKANSIRFFAGKYDHSQKLVIDPVIIWSTYFGGNNTEYSQCIAKDSLGNVVIGGQTTSTSGLASSGAFQTSYSGTYGDAFIARFGPDGKFAWSTYFGGTNTETAAAIAIGHGGNIFVGGFTSSATGIASASAYQESLKGTTNAFIARFSTSGIRSWSSYFGGKFSEYGASLAVDPSGNVLLAGTSGSAGLSSEGAFREGDGGGFIAKFSPLGSFVFCTYYYSPISKLVLDASANIIISGSSFLTKLSSLKSMAWTVATSINGDGLAVSASGSIYDLGEVNNVAYLATNGAYQTKPGGNSDIFLAKYDADGNLIWGTYYGGGGYEQGGGLALDASENVYITGITSSASGITGPTSQKITSPNSRAFITIFSPNGDLISGSYFGGGSTIGTGILLSGFGDIFMTGYTTSGVATTDAYKTSLSGPYDAFLTRLKMGRNDAGISLIQNPAGTICNFPHTVWIHLSNYGLKEMDSVTINWSINRAILKPYTWKGNMKPLSTISVDIATQIFPPGQDTIKIWTSNPNGVFDSIPQNDSGTTILSVRAQPVAFAGGNKNICLGSSVTLGMPEIAGHTYLWTAKETGFSNSSANPVVFPKDTTHYYLQETIASTGCTSIDSAIITVGKAPAAKPGKNQTICDGTSATIGSAAVKGNTYKWFSKPLGINSDTCSLTVFPDTTTTYYLKVTDSISGCSKSDSVRITVNPLPNAIAGKDTFICEGTSAKIGSITSPGNIYSWISKPAGFISVKSSDIVSPSIATIYYLKQTILETGCTNTASVKVSLSTLPEAFTGPDDSVCSGSSIRIGGQPISINNYKWSCNSGFSSDSANPLVTPPKTTDYFLTETSANGCKKTNSIHIVVLPLPGTFFYIHEVSSDYTCLFSAYDTTLNSYEWDFGDSSPTGIGNRITHKYSAPGTYMVKFRTVNALGCVYSTETSLLLLNTGIEPIHQDNENFMVYPNPAQSMIAVSVPGNIRADILIYDEAGRLVLNYRPWVDVLVPVKSAANEPEMLQMLDIHSLQKGIYLGKAVTNAKVYTFKLIKL